MASPSDNWKADVTIQEYVRLGLKMRVEAGNALDSEDEEKFREWLSRFYREYFDKFDRRNKIERPEFAVTESLGVMQPRPIQELNMEQCKALYFRVCRLQEKLGHTSIETREWEQEGI